MSRFRFKDFFGALKTYGYNVEFVVSREKMRERKRDAEINTKEINAAHVADVMAGLSPVA